MLVLWLCGIALTASLAVATHWLSLPDPRSLVVLLLAFIPYSIAVWHAPRLPRKWSGAVILLIGLAVRAILLSAPYTLTDDAYRYHWEGTVQQAGRNPYRDAPDAPILKPLRDVVWQHTAYQNVSSAYPPLALLVFRLGAALSPDPAVFKWLFGTFDCATILLLAGWLRSRGQNPAQALVWAWNPLVLLEFAGMGHEMSLAIFFFVAGLWALERCTRNGHDLGSATNPHPPLAPPAEGNRALLPSSGGAGGGCRWFKIQSSPSSQWTRWPLVGLLFACSLLSQLFAAPLILAVVLAKRIRTPGFWLAFLIVVALGLAPFLNAGHQLGLGLLHFGAEWKFNGSLFPVLVWLFDNDRPRQVAEQLWLAYAVPKYLAAAGLALLLGWNAYRRAEPARAALAAAIAVLLFSPTVHPWYVTWLAALLVVAVHPAWLLLSASVLLAYIAKFTQILEGRWYESTLVTTLEYLPVYLWVLVEFSRALAARPGRRGAGP